MAQEIPREFHSRIRKGEMNSLKRCVMIIVMTKSNLRHKYKNLQGLVLGKYLFNIN